MDKKAFRMCGKLRNTSNLLNHKVSLEDNKLLPQKICFDCDYAVTNFAIFSETAKEMQIKFMMESPLEEVKVEINDDVISNS